MMRFTLKNKAVYSFQSLYGSKIIQNNLDSKNNKANVKKIDERKQRNTINKVHQKPLPKITPAPKLSSKDPFIKPITPSCPPLPKKFQHSFSTSSNLSPKKAEILSESANSKSIMASSIPLSPTQKRKKQLENLLINSAFKKHKTSNTHKKYIQTHSNTEEVYFGITTEALVK
jgi:hypothetical protein